MAIMRRLLMGKKHKSAYSRVSGKTDCDCRVRKGYVPVMVGEQDAGVWERFLVPTGLMAHPAIVALLESSAEEFGYAQQGVLRIPRRPECFREVLQSLSTSTKF